jgi:hypothetical protein
MNAITTWEEESVKEICQEVQKVQELHAMMHVSGANGINAL